MSQSMRKRAIGTIVKRCLRLKCPVCGEQSIVERPFKIRDRCPSCHALFRREEGFFVGAILANVVTTELVILAIYLLSIPIFSSYDQTVLTVLFAVAIIFPIAFYHHSWSLWLGFDHLVESLPHDRNGHARRS
jgi:uncharacterized protein (DUF983 family)